MHFHCCNILRRRDARAPMSGVAAPYCAGVDMGARASRPRALPRQRKTPHITPSVFYQRPRRKGISIYFDALYLSWHSSRARRPRSHVYARAPCLRRRLHVYACSRVPRALLFLPGMLEAGGVAEGFQALLGFGGQLAAAAEMVPALPFNRTDAVGD